MAGEHESRNRVDGEYGEYNASGIIMKVAVQSLFVVFLIGSVSSHPKVDKDAMEDIIQDILGSRAMMNDQAGEMSDTAISTELPTPPTPPPPRSASAKIPSHPTPGDMTVTAKTSSTPGVVTVTASYPTPGVVTVTAASPKTSSTPRVVTVTRVTPRTPPPPHSATVSTATPPTPPPPHSATTSVPTPPTPGVVTVTSSPAHTDKYLKKIYRLLFAIFVVVAALFTVITGRYVYKAVKKLSSVSSKPSYQTLEDKKIRLV